MGFETVMLSVVKDVVRHAEAEFQYGTLFIEKINKDEAKRILKNLEHFARCKVLMSENIMTKEFAYDFT